MRPEPIQPIAVAQLELSDPSALSIQRNATTGVPYKSAYVLVRLHRTPIGTVHLDLDGGPLDGTRIAAELGPALRARVAEHLEADALDRADDPLDRTLWCQRDDAEARAHASSAGTRVSVVVPTRGRPVQLERCVASILANRWPDIELIVVDNAPSNGITKIALSERFGNRVRYVPEPTRGASRARNAGLRAARGDIVAFADDDEVVDDGWISALVTAFAREPQAACATGLVLPAELDTPEQIIFESLAGFGRGWDRVVYRADMRPPPTRLFPYTPGSMGASNNMALRRQAALALDGGFDTRLGPGTPAMGAEDLDLFTRILRSGAAIVYEPRALVWHQHRRASKDISRQVYSYGIGATAMLAKWALTEPDLRRRLLRSAPGILRTAFSPHGVAERSLGAPDVIARPDARQRPQARVPKRLVATYVAGYVVGPQRWLRSCSQARRTVAPARPELLDSRFALGTDAGRRPERDGQETDAACLLP